MPQLCEMEGMTGIAMSCHITYDRVRNILMSSSGASRRIVSVWFLECHMVCYLSFKGLIWSWYGD